MSLKCSFLFPKLFTSQGDIENVPIPEHIDKGLLERHYSLSRILGTGASGC
jgi:hypothetical protein